jgi:hypothetical protein
MMIATQSSCFKDQQAQRPECPKDSQLVLTLYLASTWLLMQTKHNRTKEKK